MSYACMKIKKTRLKGLQSMSADRGNKKFNVIIFSRYARYSNKNQRLSLLSALILPLEAISQSVWAIPLGLGTIPRVLGATPWAFGATPLALGANPQVLGATSGRQGRSLGYQRLTPVFTTLNSHHLGKCHRKKLLATSTIGQMENATENNYLQHLQQGK